MAYQIPKWKKILVVLIASGAFVGYFPVAPGTAGSVLGAIGIWQIRGWGLVAYLILLALLFGLGVWACDAANKIFKKADSPRIVIDEIVGLMVTMIGIPVTAYWLLWGFLFFRFFDVVKFPPAKWFDTRLKNGWGVMLDDVAAGVYGNILLHLMLRASF